MKKPSGYRFVLVFHLKKHTDYEPVCILSWIKLRKEHTSKLQITYFFMVLNCYEASKETRKDFLKFVKLLKKVKI